METVDITIIGAGVVGLAVAAKVSRAGRTVYLLEKNERFGLEQSSRNSEVIHAGIYYLKDSLKSKLCLEGNHLIYDICSKNSIPHLKCGKIFVAALDSEVELLELMYERGRANGAPLEMLSRRKMAELEPEMKAVAAFYSPETGIVDSRSLMQYYLSLAGNNGVQVAYKTRPVSIEKTSDGYKIEADSSSSRSSFISNVVINSAGLRSDAVAAMAGIDIEKAGYRLEPSKGEYYSVSGGRNKLIKHLIYPVPVGFSVGIHVCFDMEWRLRLGPSSINVTDIDDYSVDDSWRKIFEESSIMKALPFIQPSDLEPESSGIMAVRAGGRGQFRDFIIRDEKDSGLPGFIDLVGIDSPGLTSSPAIARYVSGIVDGLL